MQHNFQKSIINTYYFWHQVFRFFKYTMTSLILHSTCKRPWQCIRHVRDHSTSRPLKIIAIQLKIFFVLFLSMPLEKFWPSIRRLKNVLVLNQMSKRLIFSLASSIATELRITIRFSFFPSTLAFFFVSDFTVNVSCKKAIDSKVGVDRNIYKSQISFGISCEKIFVEESHRHHSCSCKGLFSPLS